jgi:nicotinamide mononucleotide adenylyltransferase
MLRFNQLYMEGFEDVPQEKGRKECVIFTGRTQPPTKAHVKIVEDAYKKYKKPVAIFLIRSESGKNTGPFSAEVQEAIFDKSLKGVPHKVFFAKSANIVDFLTVLRNENYEPIAFFCGTDRFKSYEVQIGRYAEKLNYSIEMNEVKRDMESKDNVSGTAARASLSNDDFEEFKRNMAPGVWPMFGELKKLMNGDIDGQV